MTTLWMRMAVGVASPESQFETWDYMDQTTDSAWQGMFRGVGYASCVGHTWLEVLYTQDIGLHCISMPG